jgi:sporulation protein YlmC with PRC-barrel domain
MTKKLMLSAALSALMVSGAFAQSNPPTPPAATSQPSPAADQANKAKDQANKAQDEANKAKDQANKAQNQANNQSASTSAQPQFVAEQKPDDFLASKFRGKDVVGSNGKKIGEIGDILFDKNGKILAYVVSTGGFLGVGAKEVAMPPSAFQVVPGQNGGDQQLKVSLDENQLKNAQKFTEYKKPQPTTTGAGGGAAPGGLGGGGMSPGGAGAR